MDALRQQLARIQQQLAGLSASQKMLTFALVAIMVMTLFGWSRFASTSDSVSILGGNVSDSDLTRATEVLSDRNIEYRVSGKNILVPIDQRRFAVAALAQKQALPTDSTNSFLSIISEASPFANSKTIDARLQYAQQQEVTQILKGFDNVLSAGVLLNLREKKSMGNFAEPSADISLKTRDRELSKSDTRTLALAAVNLVARGCGIKSENVTISINGKSFRATGESDFSGASYLETRMAFEGYISSSIAENLQIEGVRCTVSSEIETNSSVEASHTPDATKKVSMVKSETTDSSNSNIAGRSAGEEPGMTPNVGLVVGTAPGTNGGQTSMTEGTSTINDNDWGKSDKWTTAHAGKGTVTGVSVQVPRSYLARVYRSSDETLKNQPLGEAFETFALQHLARIKNSIIPIAGTAAETIQVNAFYDLEPLVDPALAAAPGVMTNLVSQYGKQAVLGAMALAGLAMVARMVKKAGPISVPGPVLAGVGAAMPRSKGGPPIFGGDMLAGEAIESAPPMMGQELDEQVLETSQMIDQVSSLVKDNPEAAAKLIKRWMNRV